MGGKAVGLIGLGVMGQNLAVNFQRHGYSVAVYNRTEQKTRDLVQRHPEIAGYYSLPEFVEALDRPRRILLMLTAGAGVDVMIENLRAHLSPEDVLMDGGNSFFKDTERRCGDMEKLGVHFMGIGVSGGEEGALKGPCIMAGGPREGYEKVSRMLTDIAARADGPCCQLLGPRGAGHYVKMVHNGIEYAIIQTIAEAYHLLERGARLSAGRICDIFRTWNQGDLNSFLFEIAIEVLEKVDPDTGKPLVSVVLDAARQKGTGKWTSQNAMDLGIPTPTIDAAVDARNLSALKEERTRAAKALKRRARAPRLSRTYVNALKSAVYGSIIVSYAQGFHLMRFASNEYGYGIPLGEVARIWKGGCIIRAKLLDFVTDAFRENQKLQNLMLDEKLGRTLMELEKNWRQAAKFARECRVPIPAISASLDYYDSYRSERLPANLVQLLRDRFGSHGYERIDKPGHFHTDWSS